MEKRLGQHILIELYDCREEKLRDVAYIKSVMIEAAKVSNATIVDSTFHHFSPLGVSGVVVIKESHLSIHTWPEYKYAAVDIFTCGDNINPWDAFNYLETILEAGSVSVIEISRGKEQYLRPFAK